MGVPGVGGAVFLYVYSCVRYDEWLKEAMMNNETISNHTLRTLECDPHLFDEVRVAGLGLGLRLGFGLGLLGCGC